MERRTTIWRTVARGAATLLATTIMGLTAIAPAPAGAIAVPTGTTDVLPVTWVGSGDRQSIAMTGAGGTILIARDTRAGEPDATFGTYQGRKGVRAVTIDPPAPGATMHRFLSANRDGTITTVWAPASCSGSTALCDRWYVRVTADGTTLPLPLKAIGSAPPLRALDDGSVLTGVPGGSVSWRSSSGMDRGTLPLAVADLDGAAVDLGGRLLVTSTSGTITRWPAGGPADLTIPTSCTAHLAIGVGLDDDGFATACGASTAAGVVTTRYNLDGTVRWTTTGVTADHATLQPTLTAIDGTDRVWIAGRGTYQNGGSPAPIAALATVTEAGPQSLGYQRLRQGISQYDREPSGITSLRPVFGENVVFADLRNCCDHAFLGALDNDEVLGQILPAREPGPVTPLKPPRCTPRNVKIVAATRTTATVTFQGCAAGSAGPAPTGYLVEDQNYYRPWATTTGLPATPDATLTATLTAPSPPGTAIYVSAINDDGAAPSAPFVTTFLPFRSYDEFIDRQFVDFVGRLPTAAEHADALSSWVYGHDSTGLIGHLIGLETSRPQRSIEPVARLYRAYLLRDPDASGLKYWVGRREAGATLGRISEQFARSGEFTRRYGALSNRAFVTRIYTDVLGRTGDPAGIDFWTKQLDTRHKDRGTVMVGFSESNEYVTKTARFVEPVSAFFTMLGRVPGAADSALVSDWRREVVAAAIFRTDEYDARIP